MAQSQIGFELISDATVSALRSRVGRRESRVLDLVKATQANPGQWFAVTPVPDYKQPHAAFTSACRKAGIKYETCRLSDGRYAVRVIAS